MLPLAPLDAAYPRGARSAVDDAGVVAGWVDSAAGPRAVRWPALDAAPVPIELAVAPAAVVASEARAIDAAGDVAGRATLDDGRVIAFVDRVGGAGAGATVLPGLPGATAGFAEALGLDDLGRVVGAARGADGAVHAVLWTDGAIVALDDALAGLPTGVRYLSAAVGIDGARRIAAEAVMASGVDDEVRRIAILTPIW
ncbi:MAG: hypothetical protein H6708_06215 [Kofleriaceae bacterium]|nr:hypothetical protein [Kofleriaceae bacterium]